MVSTNEKPGYKVLIVDDSALIRSLLTEIINQAPDLEVVGAAVDPYQAREKIKELNPDVITLDVEMPKMDGITFLKNLMRLRPMPVVMISSLTEHGAQVTMDALDIGAIDFVAKPKLDIKEGISKAANTIIEKVRAAAQVTQTKLMLKQARQLHLKEQAGTRPPSARLKFSTTDKIIAIGSSTGGLDAIREVLTGLATDVPGIVIAQHIPGTFSKSFAERMDRRFEFTVEEAFDGAPITPGRVYIAPGDKHLIVSRDGAKYTCRLRDGELVNRHKPSVEVLFDSVCQVAGKNALAIMLTGMGRDGADAMLRMKHAGIYTIVQDEETSVVWGMPGAAVQVGAANEVTSIEKIPQSVMAWLKEES